MIEKSSITVKTDLLELFHRAVEKKNLGVTYVLESFMKDYIVSDGHPVRIGNDRPWQGEVSVGSSVLPPKGEMRFIRTATGRVLAWETGRILELTDGEWGLVRKPVNKEELWAEGVAFLRPEEAALLEMYPERQLPPKSRIVPLASRWGVFMTKEEQMERAALIGDMLVKLLYPEDEEET